MMNPLNPTPETRLQQAREEAQRLRESYLNPPDTEHKKLKKAAQEFEGVFVKQLMDAMDKTVTRTGILDGGHAEEMFRGMMNNEIALKLSTRTGGSGFGLAETIYKQMSSTLGSGEKMPSLQMPSDLPKMPEPPSGGW